MKYLDFCFFLYTQEIILIKKEILVLNIDKFFKKMSCSRSISFFILLSGSHTLNSISVCLIYCKWRNAAAFLFILKEFINQRKGKEKIQNIIIKEEIIFMFRDFSLFCCYWFVVSSFLYFKLSITSS